MILSWAALAFFLVPGPFPPSSFFSFRENKFNMTLLNLASSYPTLGWFALNLNKSKITSENVKAFIYNNSSEKRSHLKVGNISWRFYDR